MNIKAYHSIKSKINTIKRHFVYNNVWNNHLTYHHQIKSQQKVKSDTKNPKRTEVKFNSDYSGIMTTEYSYQKQNVRK